MKKRHVRHYEMRMRVNQQENADVKFFLAELRQVLGTSVQLGQLLRALARIALHSKKRILVEARRHDLDRPMTSDFEANAQFERELAHLLHIALKRAATISPVKKQTIPRFSEVRQQAGTGPPELGDRRPPCRLLRRG